MGFLTVYFIWWAIFAIYFFRKNPTTFIRKNHFEFFWHYTPQNIHSILSLRHCQHWSVFLWYWNCVVYYSFSYTKQNVPTQYRGDKTSPHNTEVTKRPHTIQMWKNGPLQNIDVTKRPHTKQMWQNVPTQYRCDKTSPFRICH